MSHHPESLAGATQLLQVLEVMATIMTSRSAGANPLVEGGEIVRWGLNSFRAGHRSPERDAIVSGMTAPWILFRIVSVSLVVRLLARASWRRRCTAEWSFIAAI